MQEVVGCGEDSGRFILSGQLKLQNQFPVKIDNTVDPTASRLSTSS